MELTLDWIWLLTPCTMSLSCPAMLLKVAASVSADDKAA